MPSETNGCVSSLQSTFWEAGSWVKSREMVLDERVGRVRQHVPRRYKKYISSILCLLGVQVLLVVSFPKNRLGFIIHDRPTGSE